MANTLKLGAGKWATGTDTVLAFNDENNNFKPLPFNFSRASSATVVNQSGLIENVGSGEPRIDFLGNTKGALLLEPSRTNLITYSEDFSQSAWVKSGTSVVSGFISPDGTNNAFKLVEGTTNSDHSIYATFTSLPSGIYTISAYVKKGERHKCALADRNSGIYVSFDLNNITVIAQGGMIGNIELLSNGWFKLSATTSNALTIIVPQIFILEDSYTTGLPIFQTYAGDGTSGVYIFGAMLEQGNYATSYIPTSGSTVTRVADACNNENLNVDYSGDYTLYLEHETFSLTEYNQFQFRQETSISYIFRVGNSINIGTNLYTTANTIGFNKFALSVTSSGSYNFYKNGVLLSSGSGLNANLETIRNDALGMSIKDIKLYNTSLTNAELQALTTI